MLDDTTAPHLILDVLDELALPATSRADLELAISHWRVVNRHGIRLQEALPHGNLEAADVALVELITSGASSAAIEAAFTNAQLTPLDTVTAIRVLVACDFEPYQPFAMICLGSAIGNGPAKAPLLQKLHGNAVVAMWSGLFDDEEHTERGWSTHCFVPARHFNSERLRAAR